MRGARGQGTVEYAGILLVVAGVLAAIVAALAAAGIGPIVVERLRCAILTVTGRPCGAPSAERTMPCVLASDEHSSGIHVRVAAFRLGSRDVLLRELRADGTVAITLATEHEGGIDLGSGVGARVRWGDGGAGVGSEVRAAALAGRATGRTWVARDAAHADVLADRIRLAAVSQRPQPTIEGSPGMAPTRLEVDLPPPDFTFTQREGGLSFTAGRGGGRRVELAGADVYGERLERRTGRRTVYLRGRAAGAARLTLPRGFGLRGEGAADERYAVTFDRDGRPVALTVLTALRVEGAAGLPPAWTRLAGTLGIPLDGVRHVERVERLDLTHPARAAAAERYFAAAGEGPGAVRAARAALRAHLAHAGETALRAYATEAGAREVAAEAPPAGARVGSEDVASRLVSAVARRPDGTWAADPACARAAARSRALR